MIYKILEILIPSVLAFVGALIGARIAYTSQIQSSSMSAFIPARLEAYSKFETAIKAARNGVSTAVAVDIYEAANAAILVASDATVAAINEVQDYVRAAEHGVPTDSDSFFAIRHRLLYSMRRDLRFYPIPKATRE